MKIRFKRLTKHFGSRTVLKDVDLDIEEGQIVFILGRSGMGKSVTLKHIVGLLKPDLGEVWVDNLPVHQLSERELFEVRRRCGMVFQQPGLLDSLSVLENVGFGLTDSSETVRRERVIECLKQVELGPEILEKKPSELSYGMKKRVSLARTLAPKPQTLLFDEPTTGLDPLSTTAINELILKLSRELGVTSIVVSHDMRCALSIADRIVFLDQGSIILDAPPAQALRSDHPLVRGFLEESIAFGHSRDNPL